MPLFILVDLGETNLSDEWFLVQSYDNKEEIVNVVINFHCKSHREIALTRSHKERYYVECKVTRCAFRVDFFSAMGSTDHP